MTTNGESARPGVVIAAQMSLLREGIASLLERTGRFRVAALCSDGEQALESIGALQPEIAIIDADITPFLGLDIARHVQEQELPIQVVILSGRCTRKSASEALRAGARAFVRKTAGSGELIEAVDQIVNGGANYVSPGLTLEQAPVENGDLPDAFETLSPREFQVFQMMVDGVRAKEIAARLQLSPKTVDTYRANLMRKLDIHDLAGLVKFAIHRELTSRS